MKIINSSVYGQWNGNIGVVNPLLLKVEDYLTSEMLVAGLNLNSEFKIYTIQSNLYQLTFDFQQNLTTIQEDFILNLLGYELNILPQIFTEWSMKLFRANQSESVVNLTIHLARIVVHVNVDLFLNEIREQKLKKILNND